MKFEEITDLQSLNKYYLPELVNVCKYLEDTGQIAYLQKLTSGMLKQHMNLFNALPEHKKCSPRKLRKLLIENDRRLREQIAQALKEEKAKQSAAAIAAANVPPKDKTVSVPTAPTATDTAEQAPAPASSIGNISPEYKKEITEYYLDMEYALQDEDTLGVRSAEERRKVAINFTRTQFALKTEIISAIIGEYEEIQRQQTAQDATQNQEPKKPEADAKELAEATTPPPATANTQATAKKETPNKSKDIPLLAKKEETYKMPPT